jgi:hypothetical protein
MREASKLEIAEGGGTREPMIKDRRGTVFVDQTNMRPEARLEDPSHASAGGGQQPSAPAGRTSSSRPDGRETTRERDSGTGTPEHRTVPGPARQRRPATWSEPDVTERPASYAIYRPETQSTSREPAEPRVRTEAK